jgi:signal transduction histidine kinase
MARGRFLRHTTPDQAAPRDTTPRDTTLRDAALPAAIAVGSVVELALLRPADWGWSIVPLVLACALLVPRRAHSLLVSPLALVVLFSPQFYLDTDPDVGTVPILIATLAVYSAGRWVDGRWGLLVLVVPFAMLVADGLTVRTRSSTLNDIAFVSILLLPPYVLGVLNRRLALQGEQLRQQQAVIRREAVSAERQRIARELHDVIAHSVSAMVVQTAAAQDVVGRDPERASALLESVASTGRKALAETGRLLHVIRDEEDELGLQPAPGLAQLPALVDQFRDSGLAVDLEVGHTLPALPAGLDLSAYRIAQEALTNALRYSADRAARLHVMASGASLVIASSNALSPPGSPDVGGTGLGLAGMAERVTVFGGTLEHGVARDGRYEMRATLPLAGVDGL